MAVVAVVVAAGVLKHRVKSALVVAVAAGVELVQQTRLGALAVLQVMLTGTPVVQELRVLPELAVLVVTTLVVFTVRAAAGAALLGAQVPPEQLVLINRLIPEEAVVVAVRA